MSDMIQTVRDAARDLMHDHHAMLRAALRGLDADALNWQPGGDTNSIAQLAAHAAGKIVVRVFYQVSDVPLYTVGGDHLITRALELCGAQNIFASLRLPAPEISVEAVLAARPDALVAGTAAAVTPAWLAQWKRWREMAAVRGNRLFVVDANLLHRPGPRFVDGVQQLCDAVERARGSM